MLLLKNSYIMKPRKFRLIIIIKLKNVMNNIISFRELYQLIPICQKL